MLKTNHNPDVLVCLANLSSEEIFTSPKLANQVLDLLPDDLWSDSSATFLDPASKSGIFPREIAKRLLRGLEKEFPVLEDRINHIFRNQIFAIAITDLTALISRRSLYCSKIANGHYSVCQSFENENGNIRFNRNRHSWQKGRCRYCGASENQYNRPESFESHAYEFIHQENPKEIFNLEFDVVIGNPPYQIGDGGYGAAASPLYDKFVNQAKKLNPRYLSMIIPARWYAGGKGLKSFREDMLGDHRISRLVDYSDSSDVFPGVSISGGVCYFLWERDRSKQQVPLCAVENRTLSSMDCVERPLNQYDTFVRFNGAVSILEKVQAQRLPSLSENISARKPFGLQTDVKPTQKGDITLFANKDVGKFNQSDVPRGHYMISKWKVLISNAHGGGVQGDFPRLITGSPIIAPPPQCVHGNLPSSWDI